MAHRRDVRFCSRGCRYSANREQVREKTRERMREWREKQTPDAVEAALEARRVAWRESRQKLISSYWEAQAGRCYLCGDKLPAGTAHGIHLDHDHTCCPKGTKGCERCRRGLACLPCNLLIGYGQDDPERLRRIAGNLAAAKSRAAREISGLR